MVRIRFTRNIQRHVACPPCQVPWRQGLTVRGALAAAWRDNPRAPGYFLDDQGAVRKHVVIFLNGEAIADRVHLGDPVPDEATIDVMQALSGG